MYCSSLASVDIGNSVATIGNEAFAECFKLKEVTCRNSNPPVVSDLSVYINFPTRTSESTILLVPAWSIDAYKVAPVWKDFFNIFEDIEDENIIDNLSVSPNPVNENATLHFSLTESTTIMIEIYDIMGNVLKQIDGFYEAGENAILWNWNINNFSNGTHICKILSKNQIIGTANIVILK
jgi:hypothetical protein